MFTFYTATVLYGEQSFGRACREIAGLGLDRVDLWHIPNWCEHLADGPDAVARTLARHGLRLEAISAYGAPAERLGELLPTLRRLGGSALVTGSPRPEVSVADFAESIRPLVARATELGVTLAIENHGNACIDSIASMIELVERLPEPGLGIALAPIHLYNRGESTADALRALKERVAVFYVWDWGPTAVRNWKDPAEQFIGTGKIDYAPIFDALVEIGYSRPLNVFAHGPEHWPPEKTSEHLRAALAVSRRMAEEAIARAGPRR
ncbi:MAG TPA: sugar phosphate isomerase/epimerase [Limnochordia bacterium]